MWTKHRRYLHLVRELRILRHLTNCLYSRGHYQILLILSSSKESNKSVNHGFGNSEIWTYIHTYTGRTEKNLYLRQLVPEHLSSFCYDSWLETVNLILQYRTLGSSNWCQRHSGSNTVYQWLSFHLLSIHVILKLFNWRICSNFSAEWHLDQIEWAIIDRIDLRSEHPGISGGTVVCSRLQYQFIHCDNAYHGQPRLHYPAYSFVCNLA